jgi:hypothetical protein
MTPDDFAALYRALSLNQQNEAGRSAYQKQQELARLAAQEEAQARQQYAAAQEYERRLGLPAIMGQPKCALPECSIIQKLDSNYCAKHQANVDSWIDARKKREADELAHRP